MPDPARTQGTKVVPVAVLLLWEEFSDFRRLPNRPLTPPIWPRYPSTCWVGAALFVGDADGGKRPLNMSARPSCGGPPGELADPRDVKAPACPGVGA